MPYEVLNEAALLNSMQRDVGSYNYASFYASLCGLIRPRSFSGWSIVGCPRSYATFSPCCEIGLLGRYVPSHLLSSVAYTWVVISQVLLYPDGFYELSGSFIFQEWVITGMYLPILTSVFLLVPDSLTVTFG